MPLYYCDVQGCQAPAVRDIGSCDLCGRHLCAMHIDKYHSCPDYSVDAVRVIELEEKMRSEELQRLNARVNLKALCYRASLLRDGTLCSTPPVLVNESLDIGHKNWHIPITFEDGVVWLCRTPHTNAKAVPRVIQDQILLSEFATYRFLSSIGVPAPAVFDVAVSSPTNAVGVSYLLMEKIPGKWLNWYEASHEGRERVIEQIANVYVKIKAHPLPSIGALSSTSNGISTSSVGPFVERGLCNLDDDGNAIMLGPFSTTIDYLKGVLRHRLDLIVRREVWVKFAVDAYFFHRFLFDNVSALPPVKDATDSAFYLVHGGSKGDHIFVDEAYNVTGLIDWECSEIMPASSAFSAPLFLIDWNMLLNGNDQPSEDEKRFTDILEAKGHSDLVRCVQESRFEYYWNFIIRSNDWNWDTFIKSAIGILRLCGEGCGENMDTASWVAWKEKMLQRYADDAGLQSLLRGV